MHFRSMDEDFPFLYHPLEFKWLAYTTESNSHVDISVKVSSTFGYIRVCGNCACPSPSA